MTSEETVEAPEAPAGEDLATLEEVEQLLDSGQAQLLDVRTSHEWEYGHVPGARHVPLVELSQAAADLGKDQPILVICRAGNRSAFAAEGLRSAGYQARAVVGGMLAWEQSGKPLEPEGGYVAESGEAAAELEARTRQGTRPPGIEY